MSERLEEIVSSEPLNTAEPNTLNQSGEKDNPFVNSVGSAFCIVIGGFLAAKGIISGELDKPELVQISVGVSVFLAGTAALALRILDAKLPPPND